MKHLISPVYAEITNPAVPGFTGSSGTEVLGNIISTVIGMIILIAAIGTFLFLAIGGLQWITAGGDKQALETARNRIVNGIVGLVIVVAAWGIMTLASDLLGLSFPEFDLPTFTQAP